MVDSETLVYRRNEYTNSFKNFPTTNTFDRDICNGKITLKEANKDQIDLLVKVVNFKSKIKPQNVEKEPNIKDIIKNLYAYFDGREFFILLIAEYFQ